MMHYYTSPLSVLLSVDPSDSTCNTVIASLAPRDLEMLRRLPSFQKWVCSSYFYVMSSQVSDFTYRFMEEMLLKEDGEEEVKRLLTQDAYFRSKISVFLEDLADYHETFSYAFQCLFSLQTHVNNPAFRKKFAVLYSLSLSTDETFDNGIRTLLQIFRQGFECAA